MNNTVTTVTSQKNPLAYAKAIATLVGTITTALLGVYAADTEVGKVLTIVSIVATAIATWAIPNAPVIAPGDPLLVNSIGDGEEGSVVYEEAGEGVDPYDPGAPLHGYDSGAGDPHRP